APGVDPGGGGARRSPGAVRRHGPCVHGPQSTATTSRSRPRSGLGGWRSDGPSRPRPGRAVRRGICDTRPPAFALRCSGSGPGARGEPALGLKKKGDPMTTTEARDEIRDLLARYTWYFDTGRGEDWASLFTDDGQLVVGDGPPVAGRAALEEMAANVKPVSMHHFIVNPAIEVDG